MGHTPSDKRMTQWDIPMPMGQARLQQELLLPALNFQILNLAPHECETMPQLLAPGWRSY